MLRHCTRLAYLGRRSLTASQTVTTIKFNASAGVSAVLQQCGIPSNTPASYVQRATFATAASETLNPPPPVEADETTESTTTPPSPLLDPDQERKLKILQLEVDVLRQEGRKVPSVMKQDHWDHVMSLTSKSARSKYYMFLWTVEMKRKNEKLRRAKKREDGFELREERKREHEEEKHIVYSLSGISYFLRIYETTMNHWHNNKLSRAMQFAPKLVLDCSYDEHMNKRECINAAKQLMFCFAENRYHDQPFDLHFCNANMAGHTMNYLHRHIPTMLEAAFPLNVHADSYLEHFPKEQLVYLTPHCNNDLTEYNPDHVYIIGAMVDTMNNEPLSLAKAKKLNLKMARLPLDRYLQWGSGSGKSLALNQMVNIMLDLKTTGNWQQSLSHVPRRKLVLEEAEQTERKRWLKDSDKMRMSDGRREWPQKKKNSWTSEIEATLPAEVEEAGGPRVNKFRRKKSGDA